MYSSVVEVDERLGNVPIQHQADDVDDKEERKRVEQSARFVKNRQSYIKKKKQLLINKWMTKEMMKFKN
jgi:hypothetical protein